MNSIAAHPLVAVKQTQKLFETTPVVGLEYESIYYHELERELKERCEQFDAVVSSTTTGKLDATADDNPSKLKHPLEYHAAQQAKKQIILSAFTVEFKMKYKSDLKNLVKTTELLERLRGLIGCPTDDEKRKAHKAALKLLTRRAETEERYTDFIRRITDTAKEIASDTVNIKYIVEEKFYDALHQKEREFVKIHLVDSKTPDTVAKLLDDKEQFKKSASISMNNHYASEGIEAKIDSKFDAAAAIMEAMLTSQRSVENENKYLHQRLLDTGRMPTIEVNAVERQTVPNTNWEPKNEWQKNWQQNKWGYPVSCHECGLRGHMQADCKGTRRVCEICGKQGHTKFAGNHHSKNELRAQMNKL